MKKAGCMDTHDFIKFTLTMVILLIWNTKTIVSAFTLSKQNADSLDQMVNIVIEASDFAELAHPKRWYSFLLGNQETAHSSIEKLIQPFRKTRNSRKTKNRKKQIQEAINKELVSTTGSNNTITTEIRLFFGVNKEPSIILKKGIKFIDQLNSKLRKFPKKMHFNEDTILFATIYLLASSENYKNDRPNLFRHLFLIASRTYQAKAKTQNDSLARTGQFKVNTLYLRLFCIFSRKEFKTFICNNVEPFFLNGLLRH